METCCEYEKCSYDVYECKFVNTKLISRIISTVEYVEPLQPFCSLDISKKNRNCNVNSEIFRRSYELFQISQRPDFLNLFALDIHQSILKIFSKVQSPTNTYVRTGINCYLWRLIISAITRQIKFL